MEKTERYVYDYPMTAITADVIAWRNRKDTEILLIRRRNEPFKGKWALPGGFVDPKERAYEGALRELKEETGLEAGYLNFECYRDDPDRDPRNRTVSFVFSACMGPEDEPVAGDDACEAVWVSEDDIMSGSMAFDHEDILTDFLMKLAE